MSTPGINRTDLQEALNVCRSSFLVAGLFSMFINLLMLTPAIYMLQTYDRVVSSGSHSTLLMLTLIMLLMMATMGGLEWVRTHMLIRISSRLDSLLNIRLFDASFKEALRGGNSTAQPLKDLAGIRQFLTGNGLFAFFDVPWIPVYLAVMFMFHPWFGLLGTAAAIVLGTIAFINERVTQKPLAQANGESIAANNYVDKSLRNAEVVASMGMLPNLRSRWLERNKKVLMLQAHASQKSGTLSSISKVTRLTVQSLTLGLGAYLVIDRQISPGLMIAGAILLGRALAPIDQMIGAWRGFVSARGQYKRLNELLEQIPADKKTMSLPEPKGQLLLEGVHVVPPGSRAAVVKGVSFGAEPGEIIGIIGPSAAGKSSLARALLGIWPSVAGKVRLDGADVSTWNREELGPFIGYLPQDIELFDGTVAENIARFSEIDDEAVVAAARMAGVHEMVLRLPEGYDTVIGAHSGVLSAGQRQRIGLARAVYGTPRLVVLDEPNSNLDDQGEGALTQALQQLGAQGTTTIVISHRTSVLSSVGKLLVLNDGQQVVFGPRDEVLRKLEEGKNASQPTPISRSGPTPVPGTAPAKS